MQLAKHWAAALDDYVIDLAWSPDGARLAAASAAGPVAVFAAGDGSRVQAWRGHGGGTNALAWHPSQPLLATGGQDGNAEVRDAGTGRPAGTAALGSAWIEHLAWCPIAPSQISNLKSEIILAAAAGRSITLLQPDCSIHRTVTPMPKTVSALAWRPDGACLAAGCFGAIWLWDAGETAPAKKFPYTNGIHALVWSDDGRWLVSGNQDPSVHLWLPGEDQEFHMSGYESKVRELSFDAAGRWLATGGGRGCCVWDCSGAGPEGREPVIFPHEAKICAVSFQTRQDLLASASADGVLKLWSPGHEQPLGATVRLPSAATKLAWSPDDRQLAAGSEQGLVYVFRCGP